MMRALKAVDAVVLFCEPVEDAGRKQWRFWCPFCLGIIFTIRVSAIAMRSTVDRGPP